MPRAESLGFARAHFRPHCKGARKAIFCVSPHEHICSRAYPQLTAALLPWLRLDCCTELYARNVPPCAFSRQRLCSFCKITLVTRALASHATPVVTKVSELWEQIHFSFSVRSAGVEKVPSGSTLCLAGDLIGFLSVKDHFSPTRAQGKSAHDQPINQPCRKDCFGIICRLWLWTTSDCS